MIVVSYRNSTSNHNTKCVTKLFAALYLIEILHQTTTLAMSFRNTWGCILSKFYIKPQRKGSTISIRSVVSYRNSTSNHNVDLARQKKRWLYLIEILHQTTTMATRLFRESLLYLIEILHQTTTTSPASRPLCCCILSKFYIKPQQLQPHSSYFYVVSYRNSTSNHNLPEAYYYPLLVVSYRNSTSNHNTSVCDTNSATVVSYRNSTSNHNLGQLFGGMNAVVSYRNSTSNHNY